MKIAFIGPKGIPARQGGIEKHTEQLSTRLASLGFDVTVYGRAHYTGDSRANYKYQGVSVINLPCLKTKHLEAISHTFIASIHALFQDYDIIHYHGVGPSLLSFIPRIFNPRAKVVATFHCIDRQHQKWNSFAKFMLALGEWATCRFPHATIAISETLQKYCRYRFDHEAIYLPNGVALLCDRNDQILSQFNLEPKKYLIAISRLVRHKGLHTLISAYNNLSTDLPLVIVGTGAQTDDYVKEIKKLANNNPKIIFTGEQTGGELMSLLANAYLFIQPSEAEGLSIALLEAMAANVPALISSIEENQEATADLALEFINKSWEDLKRKLQYAIEHEDIIKALADRAQTRVAQEYDWKAITLDTAELYNGLITVEELVTSEVK